MLNVCFVFCCYGLSVDLGGLGEEAEDVNPPRRLAKEVSGLVKDGLSQHSKGERIGSERMNFTKSIFKVL